MSENIASRLTFYNLKCRKGSQLCIVVVVLVILTVLIDPARNTNLGSKKTVVLIHLLRK